MNLRPINPPFPLFFARCVRCGYEGSSLSLATGDAPFTYVCFSCQPDDVREVVRLATNAAAIDARRYMPEQLAMARRYLGIKRPYKAPSDPSWAGCEVEGRS